MAVIRLILLVAVLGALTLLLVQNWSPVIALVFLGMRSKPLPLAIWILFSTAAGAFTTVVITILFNLSSYFERQQRSTPFRSSAKPPRQNQTRSEQPKSPRPSDPPPSNSRTDSRMGDTTDDWETGSGLYDDWEFNEKQEEAPTSGTQGTRVQDSNTYERSSEPTSSSKSGSVYSYNYREPKNSGVGKTESVYDADYRVIIPPYQPSPTEKTENEDDDWGFLDEDDVEDDDKRPRR